MRYLRIEIPQIGVEGEVESHPERTLTGRGDVGVHVPGFDPGILHPRDSASQVIVGSGTERRDPHRLVTDRHHRGDQIGRAPLAQHAQRGTGSGVSAVMPARCSATELTHMVW